ncbi:MAG: hypothetical protein NTV34_00670, partial [Proteobacteria bacterium]|nr:hypothetical protein [Pseudomonadota bacterium]
MKIAKSTISWKWSEPSEFARSQLPILWLASDFQKAEQSETDREREIHEHDINELLGSPGAYTCLQRAFRRGLSRNSAWSSEHLPLHLAADLRAAAKVFKRGVPVVPGPPDSHSNSGVSSVFFADSISEALASVTQSDAVFADANVHRIWRQSLPRHSQRIEVSESQKTLYTVSRIAKMIPADCKRVVIIGGGVLGDLAGFAAALKHKPTVYFPTTLLAMADSSIGGKTGANFEPWGKNQVGMFHPPQLVYITSDWLKSLDERPLKAGLAECLKHALIAGNDSLWT